MVFQAIFLTFTFGGIVCERGGFCHLLGKGTQQKTIGNVQVMTYLVLEKASDDHLYISSPRLLVLMQQIKVWMVLIVLQHFLNSGGF